MSRLLIVDDEERIRDIIKKYAQFEGFETVEAVDGLQAVEICRKESFDLIIMDVMMPELDGFSAVREIRKTSSTPVLMLSARGEEYDKIHGFELGIDDYVVKPFSPKELMMRVSAILKRSGGGEAQRLMLARAFAAQPSLMLVDEPTAQLDMHTAATVSESLSRIARNDTIVVVSTHDPNTRDACTDIIDLKNYQ